MLVGVWEALDAEIPRLQAAENLSQYTVALVASPYVQEDARDGVLKGWRKLLMQVTRNGSGPTRGERTLQSGSEEILEDGSVLRRGKLDMDLRQVFAAVKRAFGHQIRD